MYTRERCRLCPASVSTRGGASSLPLALFRAASTITAMTASSPYTSARSFHAPTSSASAIPSAPMSEPATTIEIPAGLPYDPFRTTLYTPEELTADDLDARIERYVGEHGFRAPPAREALAQRLHDHGMDTALGEFLCSRPRVV